MLWECPLCETRKRGPTKPRLDATVRFCLSCSAKSDRLVKRVCPALEQKRAQKEATRKAAEDRKRETKKRAEAKKAEAAEQRFFWAGQDLRVLWAQMQKLPNASDALGKRQADLAVRRCSRRPRRWGTAWYWERRAQVSVWEGLEMDRLVDTMIHELAHIISYLRYGRDDGRGHAHSFKRTYTDMFNEWVILHPESPARKDARWYLE